jgi:ABC-type cobalamin transport system ATPase subunit
MVRDSISTFSKVGNIDSQLMRLEHDISSGEWERRYSSLQNLEALDLGYRIVIADKRADL